MMDITSLFSNFIPDPFWRGCFITSVLCVLIELVGYFTQKVWRRHRRRSLADPVKSEDAVTKGYVDRAAREIPKFGQPEMVIYRPADYQESLCCSVGLKCGRRELHSGEVFFRIPWSGESDGSFFVVCADDAIIEDVVQWNGVNNG
jgi:hypothetical protein